MIIIPRMLSANRNSEQKLTKHVIFTIHVRNKADYFSYS